MGFKCGIVGLQTLVNQHFSMLLQKQVSKRLTSCLYHRTKHWCCTGSRSSSRCTSENRKSWSVFFQQQWRFVDIAGLVAGASRGEGLGNKF